MLKLINKYRKNPKRMVLTLKCKKSLYLLRQGQLNCETNSRKIVKPLCYNSSDVILETNFGRIDDSCYPKDDSVYAFNSCERMYEVDGDFEQICNENCDENLNFTDNCECQMSNENTSDFCKNYKNKRKFLDKTTKGAYVCEKTYRVLLCDVVTAVIAITMAYCIIKRIFKRKR